MDLADQRREWQTLMSFSWHEWWWRTNIWDRRTTIHFFTLDIASMRAFCLPPKVFTYVLSPFTPPARFRKDSVRALANEIRYSQPSVAAMGEQCGFGSSLFEAHLLRKHC
eukprot:SAG31_NODE_3726_length_3943_cov_3.054588_2_plen_110_part_00